ncbi:MAG: peptidylprolyl isomerase [Acidimicrobiia bacterium]
MKRIVAIVGALAFVAAACSSSPSVVATVGGTEITRPDVEGLVRDDGNDIVPADFLRYLGVAIQWEAVEQAAASDFGIDPTDTEVDDRVSQLVTEYSPDATLEEYLESANASQGGIELYARQLLIQAALEEALADRYEAPTDADVDNEITEFPLDWTEVCASHILVATRQEAEAALKRYNDGEDFAALATELSSDSSAANGGDLGCQSAARYVGEFAESAMNAEIGVPTEPVETQFGFHVLLVRERNTAEKDLVRDYLEARAKAAVVNEWFEAAVAAATVTVDDSVGVWVLEPSPQVLPNA